MDNYRFKITDDEMALLLEYTPNSCGLLNPAESEVDTYIVSCDDYERVETELDNAIIENLVNQDYLSPLGRKLQALYDNLYWQLSRNQ